MTKTSSTITVTSTGCTEKKSFETILEESKPPVATFIRVRPDPCEATPHKVNIEFSYHEVDADKFKIANPFVPGPEL
ncbi:MAG: hypothetical protein F6J92_29045 [Symploca sp. SIO1A3]|nr:hypothetical protein [Symploca sp. SIO1A3]